MTTSHKLFTFIAAGFASGWLPKAPGTWGSLAALAAAWLILEAAGPIGLLTGVLLILLLGCYVCSRVLPRLDSADPGWIVIDEWAGQWLCTALLACYAPADPYLLLLSFLMFRLFDIFKPWPVSWLEQNGPAWWTIMADDLGAGVLGAGAGIFVLRFAGEMF